MEVVPKVGGPSSGQIQGSRAHIFIYNIVHTAEDYGVITTYLRMQGVMPPSSALDEAAALTGPRPGSERPTVNDRSCHEQIHARDVGCRLRRRGSDGDQRPAGGSSGP